MKRFLIFISLLFVMSVFCIDTREAFASNENGMSNVGVIIGKVSEGNIKGGISDTFILKPKTTGQLTIKVEAYVSDAIQASLYSDYSKENMLIAGGTYNSEKGLMIMTYDVFVSPRTYYLILNSPIVVMEGKVRITTKFKAVTTPEPDKRNYTTSSATALVNDKYYHGVLAFDETEDYYLFSLKEKQQLKITVTSGYEEATEVILRNAKGEEIAKDFAFSDSRKFVFDKKLSAGRYYLVIRKGSIIVHSGRTYEISTGKFTLITKVSIPKSKTMYINDTFKIKPKTTPVNATEKCSYSSSNPKIAKISSNGTVTALKKGTVKITLVTKEGKIKDYCKITIKEVAVKSIKLNKTGVDLKEGESIFLKAGISPANASVKKVTWTSSDKQVATVTADGKVTALDGGTCKITAKIGRISTSCSVKVKAKSVITPTPKAIPTEAPTKEIIEVDSISMLSSINIYLGKTKSVNDLMAVVIPDNATIKTLTWSSTDNSIVTIDGGTITPKKVGTARIVVSSKNGKKAYCTVVVKEGE